MADRYKRLGPLAGVVMVLLVLAAVFITPSTPSNTASPAKVVSYYASHQGGAKAMAFLLTFAGLFGVWYLASVASYLRRRGSDVLATSTLAGSAILAAGFALGAGTTFVLADHPGRMTASTAQTLNLLSYDVWAFTLFGGLGLVALSLGTAILRTKAMPRAVGIISVVIGVAAVTAVLSWPAMIAFGLLTLYISGYVYQRLGRPDAITMPDVAATSQAEVPTQPITTS